MRRTTNAVCAPYEHPCLGQGQTYKCAKCRVCDIIFTKKAVIIMIVSLIVAMDQNRVIGYNNRLPWHLPRELQYVKKTTMGHPIVMGRKNYESIGRPLPGRRNIVLTRNRTFTAPGCEIAYTVDDVYRMCKGEAEIFIFGGEQIYKLFLPVANKLYLTKIHHSFPGDTFFPEIDTDEWKEVSATQGITDEKNPYTYYFHIYERKNV